MNIKHILLVVSIGLSLLGAMYGLTTGYYNTEQTAMQSKMTNAQQGKAIDSIRSDVHTLKLHDSTASGSRQRNTYAIKENRLFINKNNKSLEHFINKYDADHRQVMAMLFKLNNSHHKHEKTT